jgi:hypothetical protein
VHQKTLILLSFQVMSSKAAPNDNGKETDHKSLPMRIKEDDINKDSHKSQLGIKITIEEVESRPLPSIMKAKSPSGGTPLGRLKSTSEDAASPRDQEGEGGGTPSGPTPDTVDFYVLNIEWNQVNIKDMPTDVDPRDIQEEFRDVTVNYKIKKRFSNFQAFHAKNFACYPELNAIFPSRFTGFFNKAEQIEYRKQALGEYLNALVKAHLQPNALVAFVLFLELHDPPSFEVRRMSHQLTKEDAKLAKKMPYDPIREKSASLSYFKAQSIPEIRGFAINDVVKIVKEGSSFFGREATVTDPNWHGLVKVEVTGLIGLKAGAKTYKLPDLELVSRVQEEQIMIQDHERVLDPGILLTSTLRRHLEHSGEICESGAEAANKKATRLLEENKKLRAELEIQIFANRDDVRSSKLDNMTEATASITKDYDRLRSEKKALMKELDEAKKINADLNRRLTEVDRILQSAQRQDSNGNGKSKGGKRTSIFSSKSSSNQQQDSSHEDIAASARAVLATSKYQPRTDGSDERLRRIHGDGSGDSLNSIDTASDHYSPPRASVPVLSNSDVSLQEAIDLMNSREYASVLNGLKKLINLSLNSKEHAIQFSEMGGIGGVASILKEYEKQGTIQEKALKLLVNLSFVSEEASREMVKQDIVSCVIQSLNTHPDVIGVQVKGLWSLKNLAHHLEGAKEVHKCGGVDVATRCIKTMIRDGPIVDQGLGILQNIAHHIGSETINLAWNASGISFAELKRIHAARTHTVDIASYLEQDIFMQST